MTSMVEESSSLVAKSVVKLGEKQIRNVLREELGMRFNKIKDVAVFSNSP